MSQKPAEYLKRTCLICGCHTNQTINIYEPRSGPNIVQLIQAKFKFQPLNEDKYLCFSCNNWLINWHSLQALNSNDAESPSGTFRSSMNNLVQEQDAGAQHAARRPVAQVRPQQLTTAVAAFNLKSSRCIYAKKSFRFNHRPRRPVQHKLRQTCCCGRAIIVRMRASLNTAALRKFQTAKCRKCRDLCHWRKIYEHSLLLQAKCGMRRATPKVHPTVPTVKQPQRLAPSSTPSNLVSPRKQSRQCTPAQRLQRPLVDGKVVSMLRRLGTTLSRESVAAPATHKLPPIMSPAKQKPRWTRQLDEDEILLDFDTAISEVLPIVAAQGPQRNACEVVDGKSSRRRLTYQFTNTRTKDDDCAVINLSEEQETAQQTEVAFMDSGVKCSERQLVQQSLYSLIPSGLSVCLI